MSQIYQLDACEIVKGLNTGLYSVHDALDSLESRIEATDSIINALPTRDFERAHEQAERLESLPLDRRGLLCGLPVSIKDLTEVCGMRTTFGSRVFENFLPDRSDRMVERIEARGGIVYAKSNTPEFGTGGITFNDVFGLTRSPRDTRYASGGSSGGAAASLAAGSAWLSQGSDMAGSLRTPASFCGVASLRPSPGKITVDSEFTPYDILAADGPMARNVSDLALFADAMLDAEIPVMQQAASQAEQPLRIAFSEDLGITTVNDEVLNPIHRFIEELAKQGCQISRLQPDLSGVHDAFDRLRAHAYAISLEQTLTDQPDLMKPEVVWNIESGLALSSAQLREATRIQGKIIKRAATFMDEFDLLVCPATSLASVDAELRYPGSDAGVPVPEYYRWLAIAYATTLTALPVITLPCGFAANGMPVAVQLIGKPGGEFRLFQHARFLESVGGWNSQPIDPVRG